MKTSEFWRELELDSLLTYKDKKEIVLNHRERMISCYKERVRIFSELKNSYRELNKDYIFSDDYWALVTKVSKAQSHLLWLKKMPKRRALKYALKYHWSFTQDI